MDTLEIRSLVLEDRVEFLSLWSYYTEEKFSRGWQARFKKRLKTRK